MRIIGVRMYRAYPARVYRAKKKRFPWMEIIMLSLIAVAMIGAYS